MGIELTLVLLGGLVALALAGPGAFSVDRLLAGVVMLAGGAMSEHDGVTPQARKMPAVFFGHGNPMNALPPRVRRRQQTHRIGMLDPHQTLC